MKKMEMEIENNNKREREKLTLGTERKDDEPLEVIESVLCVKR